MQNETQDIESIRVRPLFVMKRTTNGIPVRILKDDGCNKNIVLKKVARSRSKSLSFGGLETSISHSKEGSDEASTAIVLHTSVKVGGHAYLSDWAVPGCRYDILLGVPWHVDCRSVFY